LKTGVLYANPKPYLRSIHAYFPSVAMMANGEMLATIVLGEAFDAVNLRTNVCRSTDNGETWKLEGPIYLGTTARPPMHAVWQHCLTANLPEQRKMHVMCGDHPCRAEFHELDFDSWRA
jgi:hypothetical protein